MILKSKAISAKFDIINDLRVIPILKTLKLHDNIYICALPEFNNLKGKSFYYYNNKIDLYNLKCSCEISKERYSQYKDYRDIRKTCAHIYKKLLSLKNEKRVELDNLTLLLLETQSKYGPEVLFRYSVKQKEVLFGVNEIANSSWINVYSQVKNEEGIFFRYSYNSSEKRWRSSLRPDNSTEIEEQLNSFNC
jgi:hypothetical protein